jgi:hypothetical protein
MPFIEYPIDNIPDGWQKGFQSATIQRDGKLGRVQVTREGDSFFGAVGFYKGARLPIYDREQSEMFDSIDQAIEWCSTKRIDE